MRGSSQTKARVGHDLSVLVGQVDGLQAVRKTDLSVGDRVIVKTRNSIYQIIAAGNGLYAVTGGWFDRSGLSPVTVSIAGCTWGGSAIKRDVVAACGLCLEFGNRLVTSMILGIAVLRRGIDN
jgi:hypothetical protein